MASEQSDMTGRPKPIGWATILAILVIIATTALQAVDVEMGRSESQTLANAPRVGRADLQVELITRMRAAMFAFSPDESGSSHQLAGATDPWEHGSLAQRLSRSIVLATCDEPALALEGFREAATVANKVDEEDRDAAQALLRVTAALLLAGDVETAAAKVNEGAGSGAASGAGSDNASGGDSSATTSTVLSQWPAPNADDATVASTRLGFVLPLGKALLAKDSAARDQVRSVGIRATVIVMLLGAWLVAALLGGVGALITFFVLLVLRSLRNGTGPGVPESAVLLEVFAIFMALLLGSSALMGVLMDRVQAVGDFMHGNGWLSLVAIIVMEVVVSLLALGWWRVRGGSWRSLRELAGLDLRTGSWKTVGLGFVAYSMALALGVVGFLISMVASKLAEQERLGDPKHPIHEIIMGGEPAARWLVLLLAAVIAPIVEEIFFRGALYRGLRDRLGFRGAALAAGAIGALVVSSSIFGLIHPQGVLFAPVLAGLGAGFCLMREWTGSVAPGVVAHGINNGVMLGAVMLLLG